jgi:phage protein
MINRITVTDNILIEISKQKIEIFTFLPFNIRVSFEETVVDTLDEDGKIFGKRYQLNIFAKPKYMDECTSESDVSFAIGHYRELKTFWKFVENNKNNLFDMAGYEGEVES